MAAHSIWFRCVALGASLAAPLALGALPSVTGDGPISVTLERSGKKAKLLRGGEEYFIKGAGGKEHLELLGSSGGNSIRTWGVDGDTAKLLDAAHEHGITVTLGIWLRRVGSMDYGDEAALKRQTDDVVRAVEKHKDHPALLMWALGNEMEGDGNDSRVYEQLERLATRVKALDPEHPTMTVIADLGGGKKVRDLDRLAPSIDVIGVNTYLGAASLPRRYAKAGGTRPFVVTEFGPPGHWESSRTSYGLPVEPSSTEKAESYRDAYEGAVEKEPLCLGSYAFLWGAKQETTATWYGMLLPDGTRLGAVDVMQELWTGKKPGNRCPLIKAITGVPGKKDVQPGDKLKVQVKAVDPDRDRLEVEWVLRKASAGNGSYGQAEAALPSFPDAVLRPKGMKATIRVPEEAGNYRLFVYVKDGEGGAAVHNLPLRIVP